MTSEESLQLEITALRNELRGDEQVVTERGKDIRYCARSFTVVLGFAFVLSVWNAIEKTMNGALRVSTFREPWHGGHNMPLLACIQRCAC